MCSAKQRAAAILDRLIRIRVGAAGPALSIATSTDYT